MKLIFIIIHASFSLMAYGFLLAPLSGLAQPEEPWYPVSVVSDGVVRVYEPLTQVRRAWRICALLPHGRDKYWWGVSWGLRQEANRRGVRLGIYQAGGYEYLETQRKQFHECLAKRADVIVLAAISSDGLNADIEEASRLGVPVVDLVNGVSSKLVAARSLVSFVDMAKTMGNYLLAMSGKQRISVAWFPGPQDAAWVRDAEAGMRLAFRDAPISLIHAGFAPPDLTAQMGLVRAILKSPEKQPDYFFGNAVAIEAVSNFQRYFSEVKGHSIAFYATEPVINLIGEGRVVAAASDSPVLQARISIDLALRVLEKQSYARRVSPIIDIIDAKSVKSYDYRKIFPPDSQRILLQELPPK
ncbi:TMAO reductase system periplasmic protein TorT [Duganella sp. FT135W]|uniref:TMAO reductase system periplasmic protein TorT n=1 Tax=Duganella flavida TaxID=2692175 RepID=A0A6L8K6Y3_9BURK|nr:TMAO reductase system periplasmic protein TorT [Duganella flavida]MYM23253.1 TMAO reductase system periplasmic protein TorT [Duganella flavida]